MYETLMRPHQVDVVPPLPTVASIGTQLKEMEARREAKRLRQIANSRSRVGDKRKREETEGAEDSEEQTRHADEADGSGKRVKTEPTCEQEVDTSGSAQAASLGSGSGQATVPENVVEAPQAEPPVSKISVSKAFPEVRGHTSYLTFAVLLPALATAEASANTDSATTEATPDPGPIQGS